MRQLLYLPMAAQELDEIWDYIAQYDPAAADRHVDRIDATAARLCHYPFVGRDRSELATSLRSIVIGHYLVFYQVLPDSITVTRIIHGARDLATAFVSE